LSVALNQVVAVVLAGGFGTRIQHLLSGVPKPMAAVNGRPFLEWVVRYLARQGVTRVVISTGYLADVVARHFQEHQVDGVTVQCVAETAPLGTGGGFLHAVRSSGQSPAAWLVLNGDSLIFADLAATAAYLADPAVGGVLVGRPVTDASRFGTLATGPAGDLLRFEEKRPGAGVINAGVYLLRDALVRQFPDRTPLSLEREVFPALTASSGLLKVHVMDAPFLDIGTPESLPQAEAFVRDNLPQFV
jgi:D-glycero-alpha-D-manno-heptose 1-phosphate guanylyltransferase